jgi:hypothetical protein
MVRKRVLDNEFSRRRSKPHTILSYTCKGSSIFRKDFLDNKGSKVVIIIIDLEVRRGLDDSCLSKPCNLWPRLTLYTANKFYLSTIW